MLNQENSNLQELHQILQFVTEGFCDAITLIVELPPELHYVALASCKRWLIMLQTDFMQLEKEMREGP